MQFYFLPSTENKLNKRCLANYFAISTALIIFCFSLHLNGPLSYSDYYLNLANLS